MGVAGVSVYFERDNDTMLSFCSLVIIYNDAYAKLIGSKHPGVFGKPGRVAVRVYSLGVTGRFIP